MAHTHGTQCRARLTTEYQDGPELHYHIDEDGNRTSSEPDNPGHVHIFMGTVTSPQIPIFDPNTKLYFHVCDNGED